MLMSHAAYCSAVIGAPSPGPSCAAADCSAAMTRPATSQRVRAARSDLRVNIAHLTVLSHGPRLDRVVVIIHPLAVARDQHSALRLHGSGLADRPASQNRRATGPPPRHAEARERLRQHGFLQRGFRPRSAAARRALHTTHLAAAGPRKAGNL